MMKIIGDATNEETQSIDITRNQFMKIDNQLESILENCNKLEQKTNQIDSARSSMLNMVETLSSISEENAASTEQTSATMHALSGTIDDCKKETEELSDLSTNLTMQTNRFKL